MSEVPGRANLALACALVDELVQQGVRHAVLCPGSRSTPVAVAMAACEDLRLWVHLDERSAAYFALGMARQIDRPVAVLSTSGTAAANFLPAVAEARLSRVPLIVLTADRPPEMRGWGAAQTIDQNRLYGEHAKWFSDMPVPADDPELLRQARAAAYRAVHVSAAAPAGPVHLNLPFREPLLPVDLRPPLRLDTLFEAGRAQSRLTAQGQDHVLADTRRLADLAAQLARVPRGMLVCGPGASAGLPAAAVAFAAATGYPILPDPLSGVRYGTPSRGHIIDCYDAFLRDTATAAALAPDMVIRVGAVPTSKPLQQFLAANPERHHVIIDPGDPRDPAHLATDHVRADPAATLFGIAEVISAHSHPADCSWLESWRAADRVTRAAIGEALAQEMRLCEGRVAAEIAAVLPDGATLVVGNSMPVRDADAFARGDERRLRIVGNRGANGIDGVVSSALGAAAISDGPVVLIIGDLSFYHDMNGLLAAQLFGLDATVVVLNNDGGGIFSFLPQAEQLDADVFESLFGTPIGLDVATAAALYQVSYARPTDWQAFRREFCRAVSTPGLSVVEVVTDRQENVRQHRAVWEAVSNALHSDAASGR